jgi:hypothetical protein
VKDTTDIEQRLRVIEKLLLLELPESCDPAACRKWSRMGDSAVRGCGEDGDCPLAANRISVMSAYLQQVGALVREHQQLVETLTAAKIIPQSTVESVRTDMLLRELRDRREELQGRLSVFTKADVPDEIVVPLRTMLAGTEKRIAELEGMV